MSFALETQMASRFSGRRLRDDGGDREGPDITTQFPIEKYGHLIKDRKRSLGEERKACPEPFGLTARINSGEGSAKEREGSYIGGITPPTPAVDAGGRESPSSPRTEGM